MTTLSLVSFPAVDPGPYERQMGQRIAALLAAFAGRVPDGDSLAAVAALAAAPQHWSAARTQCEQIHAVLSQAIDNGDQVREWQHYFEEACCQAMYNATLPRDPFDPSAAFYVVPLAIKFARVLRLPLDKLLAEL